MRATKVSARIRPADWFSPTVSSRESGLAHATAAAQASAMDMRLSRETWSTTASMVSPVRISGFIDASVSITLIRAMSGIVELAPLRLPQGSGPEARISEFGASVVDGSQTPEMHPRLVCITATFPTALSSAMNFTGPCPLGRPSQANRIGRVVLDRRYLIVRSGRHAAAVSFDRRGGARAQTLARCCKSAIVILIDPTLHSHSERESTAEFPLFFKEIRTGR